MVGLVGYVFGPAGGGQGASGFADFAMRRRITGRHGQGIVCLGVFAGIPFRGDQGWEYGSAGDLDRCFGLREEWMRYVCVQAGGADPFQASRCICELDLDQPFGSG